MSVRGKEVRPLIEQDAHERLSMMADFRDLQLNEFAARLLEKAIDYEWRDFSVLIDRAERTAIRRKALESGGTPKSSAEVLRQRAERDDE